MKTKELQEAYKVPKAKVVEVGIQGFLCGSKDELGYGGGTETEALNEQNLSGDIW